MTRTFILALSTVALLSACDDRRGTFEDSGTPAADAGLSDASTDAGPPDAGPQVDPAITAICARLPGFEEACIVEQQLVTIRATAAPAYEDLFPGVTAYNMNGWEWWQQWPGGYSPTMEYEQATPAGMVCSVASALRFAAVMHAPPENLARLLADTTWEGRFYNWNDDFSMPASEGDGTGATLWAWQYYLIKWISQTNRDGTCYLPTYSMLESALTNCLATGAAASGNIEGCVD